MRLFVCLFCKHPICISSFFFRFPLSSSYLILSLSHIYCIYTCNINSTFYVSRIPHGDVLIFVFSDSVHEITVFKPALLFVLFMCELDFIP